MNRSIYLSIFILIIISSIKTYSQPGLWSQTACPSAEFRYDDMSFINENTGWVIDFAGKILKTTDGGSSWDSLIGPNAGGYRSLLFLDSVNGFLGTLHSNNAHKAILFKTSDAGVNWQPVSNFYYADTSNRGGVCGMSAIADSVIYICGRFWGPAYIYKSTDYGQSWQSIDVDSLAFGLVDVYFWHKDSGIVVGSTNDSLSNLYSKSAIFKTNDGGLTWQTVYESQLQHEWCWKISVPKAGNFYVSVEQWSAAPAPRYVLKSTNYGTTWQEMQYANASPSMVITVAAQGLGFISENEGWVNVQGNGFDTISTYYTNNGGITWSEDSIEWGINRFRFVNDSVGYACGQHVFKMDKTQLSNISNISDSNTIEVYPSITSGYVNFKFKEEEVRVIMIFCSDGQLALSTTTKQNSLQLNINNLQPGTYYINIQSQSFTTTKKILLIR